jgi:hypothetical protein
LAPSETLLASRSSAPADSSAELVGAAAPLTVKVEPGSVWNAELMPGLPAWSLAQAARARTASASPPWNASSPSNHEPSSVRVE